MPLLHGPLQPVTISQVAGLFEILAGISEALHLKIGQPPVQMRLGVFGIQSQAFGILRLGLPKLLQGVIGVAAIVVSLGIFGIDLDGLVKIHDGLLVLLHIVQRQSTVIVGFRRS